MLVSQACIEFWIVLLSQTLRSAIWILSHLQASKLAFTVSRMFKEDVRHLSQKEKTVSPTAQDKKHELFISIPLVPKFHQRNTKEPR